MTIASNGERERVFCSEVYLTMVRGVVLCSAVQAKSSSGIQASCRERENGALGIPLSTTSEQDDDAYDQDAWVSSTRIHNCEHPGLEYILRDGSTKTT